MVSIHMLGEFTRRTLNERLAERLTNHVYFRAMIRIYQSSLSSSSSKK